MKKGGFIVFEGIDGCGKSTQIGLLKRKLMGEEIKTFFTEEPCRDLPAGRLIGRILSKKLPVDPIALQLAFSADRKDHWERVIRPALMKNDLVVCDRYFWSTVAYGSLAAGIDWLLTVNKTVPSPDLTFLIDVLPETAIKRIFGRRKGKTIFEKKDKLVKTRKTYFSLARKFGKECFIIDGERDPGEIHREIYEKIIGFLKK